MIRSRVSCLCDQTGNRILNLQRIANEFGNFFCRFYHLKNDPTTLQPTQYNIEDFLDKLYLLKLSSSQVLKLSSPFTAHEIFKVIDPLSLRKSPGEDQQNIISSLAKL